MSASQSGSAPPPDVRAGTRSFAVMQFVRMLGAFAVASLVSRQLGADGKGMLALVQQVPSIMALVVGFGFAGVNVYYVGSGRRTSAEALTDSLLVAAAGTLVGVPASVLLMRLLPALADVPTAVLAVAALVVPLGVLSSQLAGILVGEGRAEWQARAQSLAVVVQVSIVGVLYILVRLTVMGAVAATLAGTALSLVIMFVVLMPWRPVSGSVARILDAGRYARKRYLTDIAAMLEMRVDILMLGMLSTVAATGVYSVAVAVVELLWFLPRAAETPLLSRFLKAHAEQGAALVAVTVRLTVMLEAVMLAGAALLLRPTVALVFGPAFEDVPILFWALAPGVVMNALVGPVISYLTSRGHQFPGLSALTLAGNIALNIVLIPRYGALGAALSSSVTYGVGSIWLFARFVRETGIGLDALFLPRAEDVRLVVRRKTPR